jgi:hypothetical protein
MKNPSHVIASSPESIRDDEAIPKGEIAALSEMTEKRLFQQAVNI